MSTKCQGVFAITVLASPDYCSGRDIGVCVCACVT